MQCKACGKDIQIKLSEDGCEYGRLCEKWTCVCVSGDNATQNP
jgi:hypothetical protein